ncbi:hypothetical protein ACIRF8_27190 [Streptomyces sp. NPDC102406]|uniref:hypothetical protein n=1 Tax=Streptomyces sp. NPDC102406 TaxID=3366171 RepID=UPI0038099832
MTLAVEPGDLIGYAGLLRRAGEDCDSALAYLDRSTRISFSLSGPVWDIALGDHAERSREARDVLTRFGVILGASKKELKKTASWYRSVDLEQARALDTAYPTGSYAATIHRIRPSGTLSFTDVHDAVGHLKPAGSSGGWLEGHADEFKFAPIHKTAGTLLDIGSPSALANEGIKMAFGWDVLSAITQWLSGDWQEYAECADAWDCLGDFCAAAADNIRHGNEVLGTTWRGNAADAAWKYFDKVAARLDSARDAFHELRDRYTSVTKMVFSFAELAKGALADLCDKGAQAAIAAAASTAMALTGVGFTGSFVGVALAVERVNSMVQTYHELVKDYDRFIIALNALLGGIGLATVALSDELKKFPVVGKSYDNKLV